MTKLTKNTRLQRVPELSLRLLSDGSVHLLMGGQAIRGSKHGLAILQAFSQPTTIQEALAVLPPAVSRHEWMERTALIRRFWETGVLVDVEARTPPTVFPSRGFAAPRIHTRMLQDRTRTEQYLRAIAGVVQPGDVVVEIGTGTGILALAAARAGARKVYAIEATRIGSLAQRMFAANGFSDRITLISGWSTQVTLPEPADVLISEIIGNNPLGEQVLEATLDARQRLLKPNARMVPQRLAIYGIPMAIPEETLQQFTFSEAAVENWATWYGFDFSPLRNALRGRAHVVQVNPQRAKHWSALGAPILFADLNLGTVKQPVVDQMHHVVASEAGCLNAVLVYFTLDLGNGYSISTAPEVAPDDNHWKCPVWLLGEGVNVEAGDTFAIRYTYRTAGQRNGITLKPASDL